MSKKGKIPIEVPKDVKINVESSKVHVEGPKGKLDLVIPHGISVEFKENKINVLRQSNVKQNRANHGTIRSRLAQNVIGVTQGHKRELEIQGIGFRAALQGNKIVFNVGFSHLVEFDCPQGIKVTVPTQTAITVEGVDNVLVGQVAAQIRKIKPAEPYKGKGIRYLGEIIRRKQGKSVTK